MSTKPHPPMTQAKDRVAKLCWVGDGKPEACGLGTVGYYHYRDAAHMVISALIDLGYTITAPKHGPRAKAAGAKP